MHQNVSSHLTRTFRDHFRENLGEALTGLQDKLHLARGKAIRADHNQFHQGIDKIRIEESDSSKRLISKVLGYGVCDMPEKGSIKTLMLEQQLCAKPKSPGLTKNDVPGDSSPVGTDNQRTDAGRDLSS